MRWSLSIRGDAQVPPRSRRPGSRARGRGSPRRSRDRASVPRIGRDRRASGILGAVGEVAVPDVVERRRGDQVHRLLPLSSRIRRRSRAERPLFHVKRRRRRRSPRAARITPIALSRRAASGRRFAAACCGLQMAPAGAGCAAGVMPSMRPPGRAIVAGTLPAQLLAHLGRETRAMAR